MKGFSKKCKMQILLIFSFIVSVNTTGCITADPEFDQLISVSGNVIDQANKESISEVTIGISTPLPLATDSVTSVDSLGQFSFTVETRHSQNLTVNFKSDSFADTTEVIEIKPGHDLKDIIIQLTSINNSDKTVDDDRVNYDLESISKLKNVDISDLATEDEIIIKNFYESVDGGGGVFVWDQYEPKSNHNGGTVIDPDHQAVAGSSDWYSAANSGTGCWKRPQTDIINVLDFGIIGDNSSDHTKAVRKILSLDIPNIHFPAGTYLIQSAGISEFKKITGQPGQTTIKALEGGNGIFTFESQNSKIGFTVKDIMFDMNNISKPTIKVTNPKDVTIDRSTFANSAGNHFVQHIIQDINQGGAYGEANISITNSRFENNNKRGSVNIATYDSHLTYGIENIHIENNVFYNVGGSVLAIRAIVPGHKRPEIYDSFIGVTVKNNRFENLSGGTEKYGPIPLEFWGLSKFSITGNSIDSGSLGIGTLESQKGMIENNTISNQKNTSFEVSGTDLTFKNNRVTNSHSFMSANGDTDGITIENNTVSGSIRTNMKDADLISLRSEGISHKNWLIENNTFKNYYGGRSYIMIGWGYELVKNFTIRGNSFISETSDSPVRAIYVQHGQDITIENNDIIYEADIPADSGEKPFIGVSPSDEVRSANVTIKGNLVDFRGTADPSSNLVGIGSQGWVKGTLPNLIIEENTVKGEFLSKYSYAFKINETGGNASVFNNNVIDVEGNLYELHPSVNSDVTGSN